MEGIVFREPVNAWTHGAWGLFFLPVCFLLYRRAQGNRLKQVGFLIFGISLILCFAGSCLYHGVRLSPETIEFFATLDYIGVYLLIAGTTTPILLVVLRGAWRWGILTLVWSMGMSGIVLQLLEVPVPTKFLTATYVVMGWTGLVSYLEMARHVNHRSLSLLWIGGVLYSVGAILNVIGWPNLWPGVFGAHEFFHLVVMAGSLCHIAFMFKVLVPFERRFPRCLATTQSEPVPA